MSRKTEIEIAKICNLEIALNKASPGTALTFQNSAANSIKVDLINAKGKHFCQIIPDEDVERLKNVRLEMADALKQFTQGKGFPILNCGVVA